MKITVIGAGYVGLSLSVLLSQKHEVIILDIDKKKVDMINKRISPFNDVEIKKYLSKGSINLKATLDKKVAYDDPVFIIIATPTNYDNSSGAFDTSKVENVLSDAFDKNKMSTIIIKSTVPIGFTDSMRERFKSSEIFFSPEFLREGKALFDNLNPSRIVVGDNTKEAKIFGDLLLSCTEEENRPDEVYFMSSKEAEAVKLFSNTYLAMRVAFFNELDTFSEVNNVSSEKIINAVCADPRIGINYNNPSFGYGGYCLPKDTKQLLNNFDKIPNDLIKAVINSNQTRKEFIKNSVLNKSPESIGIYRLAMKTGSDNFRESAVLDLMELFINEGLEVILFEPLIEKFELSTVKLENNFEKFILNSDIIIANRLSDELNHVKDKVYSRDIFKIN
ncbi:MAG: nucleotide sugar dehydrogenase [Candidatus Pelagibacterales bacterium]